MPERVAIIGTESTGKSALAAALADHFRESWAAEYVRTFWDQRGGIIQPADLPTIARGQVANEEGAAARAERVVFCDTDLLTNVFWADELYGGAIPKWMRAAAHERSARYALYLWCEPDLPWEYDPQRCFADPATWQASARRCRAAYAAVVPPVVTISGVGQVRLARAIAAVEQVLG